MTELHRFLELFLTPKLNTKMTKKTDKTIYYKPENLKFIGDVHGAWHELIKNIKQQPDGCTYVQLGDFCLGRPLYYRGLKLLDQILAKKQSTMFIIRGNHDNPMLFSRHTLQCQNIATLEDGSLIEIEGYKLLISGGGISVDRKWRRENNRYWKNEEVQEIEVQEADIFVSHSAPIEAPPFELSPMAKTFVKNDPDILVDVDRDRVLLQNQFDASKARLCVHGHYHRSLYTHTDDHRVYKGLDWCEVW